MTSTWLPEKSEFLVTAKVFGERKTWRATQVTFEGIWLIVLTDGRVIAYPAPFVESVEFADVEVEGP